MIQSYGYLTQDIEETLDDPSRLRMTCHHGGLVPRKCLSIRLWLDAHSSMTGDSTIIWLQWRHTNRDTPGTTFVFGLVCQSYTLHGKKSQNFKLHLLAVI